MVTQLLYTYETTEDALLLYYLVKKIETKLICNSANNIRCNIVSRFAKTAKGSFAKRNQSMSKHSCSNSSFSTYLPPPKVLLLKFEMTFSQPFFDEIATTKKKKQLRCQPYQVRNRVTNCLFSPSCRLIWFQFFN